MHSLQPAYFFLIFGRGGAVYSHLKVAFNPFHTAIWLIFDFGSIWAP